MESKNPNYPLLFSHLFKFSGNIMVAENNSFLTDIKKRLRTKNSAGLLIFMLLFSLVSNIASGQTITSRVSGNWDAGSTWFGGVVPTPGQNAIISAGTTVSLQGGDATIKDLTIKVGGVINAENKILTINGNLVLDGTYTSKNSAAKDLEFNGATIDGSGSVIVDFIGKDFRINTNATILPTCEIIVYGNISINKTGVTVTNNGNIEVTGNITGIDASSTWTNAANSHLTIGNTLLSDGTLNASASGNTVEYNHLGDQDLKNPSASTYHNLKIRGSGNKNLLNDIAVNGNLEINNSATFVSNNYIIDLKGNWKNMSDFSEGNGLVIFSGSGIQKIETAADEEFYDLTLNSTGGEVVLENNNIVIKNTFTMTSGILNSMTYKTVLGTSTASTGNLSHFDGSFIRGKFEQWISGTGTQIFPVGRSRLQRVLINLIGISAGGSMIGEFIESDPTNNGIPLVDAGVNINNTFVEGYWTLDKQNGLDIGPGSYSLNLDGVGFTSFPIAFDTRLLTRNDAASNWQALGTHSNAMGTTVKRTLLTTLPAQYALGDKSACTRPVTSIISGPNEVCTGTSAVTYEVDDHFPNTYVWTITGGVQASGGNTHSITVNWGATGMANGSIKVVEHNACPTFGAPVVLPVLIHSIPPSTITGKTSVPENSLGVPYSVVNLGPDYLYNWTITGGNKASGGTGSNITVNWGAAGQGTVSVRAEYSGCIQAPPVTITVKKYDVIESVASGDWDNTATWDCGCVPLATQSARIRNGHIVNLHNSNDFEIINLVIDPGGVLDYNSRPFKVHGDFIVNGLYDGNSNRQLTLDGIDKDIDGVGTVNGGFNITTGNKTISSTAVLSINDAIDVTKTGNIELGNTVFVTNYGKVILKGSIIGAAAASTWMNSDNSVLEISGTLLATGVLKAFSDGNNVNYTGTAPQVIKMPFNSTYHDLTASNNSIKSTTGALTINGNITINGPATLDVTVNNYAIAVKGNWVNNAGTFNSRLGTVTFNGTSPQAITEAETFYNLVYSNATGNLILQNGDVVVKSNLNMAGRDIITGSRILKIGTGTATPGSLTYSSGILIGKIERWVPATFGDLLFPVGKAGSYNPATLTVRTPSAGSILCEFKPIDPLGAGLPLTEGTFTVKNQFTEGYWDFQARNGFASTDYDVHLEANNFNSYQQNINTRIIKRTNGGTWMFDGTHLDAVPPTINRMHLTGGISNIGTQFGIGFVCVPATIAPLYTSPSCFGLADGKIDLTVSGGLAPYNFVWSHGPVTEDVTNLAAGLYSVTVTDTRGCITPAIFNLLQPAALNVTQIVTAATCVGSSDGAIDLSVAGGTAPYIYGWTEMSGPDFSASTEDITGLSARTYQVKVKDANGCEVTKDIIVAVGDYTGPVLTCPGSITAVCDISEKPAYADLAAFLGAGGIASDACGLDPASFMLQSETSSIGTCPKTYIRTYYIEDISGNSTTCQQTIVVHDLVNPTASDPAPVTVRFDANVPAPDITVVTDAADNCTAFPTVSYDADISDGGTCPKIISRIYKVTDNCGNFINVTQLITVTNIPDPPAAPAAQSFCTGAHVSDLSATPPSGTVLWYTTATGGAPLAPGDLLINGTYYAQTFNICVSSTRTPVVVTLTALPIATFSYPGSPYCIDGADPTPTFSGGGLAGIFSSTAGLSINAVTGQIDLSSSTPGPYTVTNTIAASGTCPEVIATTPVTINTGTPAVPGAITGTTAQCPSLAGETYSIGAVSGATTYTWTVPTGWSVTGGAGTTSITVTTGAAGQDGNITVTSGNSCGTSASNSLAVTVSNITGSASVTSAILCTGGTATVTLTGAGGTGALSYTFNGVTNATGVFPAIPAGLAYAWSITDAGTCTPASGTIDITEPLPLTGSINSQTNASVFGASDGSVEVIGLGGTGSYEYSLNAGTYQSSGIFGSLAAGSYTVTVRDINLCNIDVPVVITQPSGLLSGTATEKINIQCFGTASGSVTIAGSGGVSPYDYQIDGGPWQTSGTFDALVLGNYIVTVRDAALNTFDVPVSITSPTAAVGSAISQVDVKCFGNDTGSITVTGTGGIGPYEYSIDGGAYQVSGLFSALSAGTHTVTVKDTNDCTSSTDVAITGPAAALTGSISSQTDVSCSGLVNGSVTIAGTGGTAPYSYSLNAGAYQVSGIFNGLAADSYTITIRDANLCTVDVPVTITEPSAIEVTFTKEDATCPDEPQGSITLSITGGLPPYNVMWSDGPTTINRTNLTDTTYTAIIRDVNGCPTPVEITIGFTGSNDCIEINEIITPNSDGHNDTWKIRNIDLFPNAEVFVFNRWGKRVFSSRNVSADEWDGTYKGKTLPTDSYHYILHLNDGSEPRSGVVSIIR